VLLDLRPVEVFAAGHIPGAVHLDLFGVSLIDTEPVTLADVDATRPEIAALINWFEEFKDRVPVP